MLRAGCFGDSGFRANVLVRNVGVGFLVGASHPKDPSLSFRGRAVRLQLQFHGTVSGLGSQPRTLNADPRTPNPKSWLNPKLDPLTPPPHYRFKSLVGISSH